MTLKETIAQLGIVGLESFASGTPTRITIVGFATDAAHEQRIAEALAAHPEVDNDVVPIACKPSGPFASALDGSAAASKERLEVRALLDRAAVLRANNEYSAALKQAYSAVNIAKATTEPALLALGRYAVALLTSEGAPFLTGFSLPPEQLYRSAAQAFEGHEGDDRILARNLARRLARLTKR
jgi:hypothetical protein